MTDMQTVATDEAIVRRFAPPEPVPDEELADQPPADPTIEGTEGVA